MTTTLETRAVTTKPTWATEHREDDASVNWSRPVLTETDGTGPDTDHPCVEIWSYDYMTASDDDSITFTRGAPRVLLGADDLSVDAARKVHAALTEALRLLDE